jgi:hypothetical protein
VAAAPDTVFATITDLARLAEWNRRMTGLVEMPDRLTVGAEWVVGFVLMGRKFNSRSTVLELDPVRRRFVHRSRPDDDNPSHTIWTWQVVPEGAGSQVTLAWHLKPRTPLRHLMARIRAWQIPRQDVPASLAALARACETTTSHPERAQGQP